MVKKQFRKCKVGKSGAVKQPPRNMTKCEPSIIKDTLFRYLRTTSLHGLKFIGDTSLRELERLFFLLAFIFSILISSYYIYVIYTKWRTTPIIITTSATSTSIASIPFPAITICNLNQAKRSLVEKIKPGNKDYINLLTLCKIEQDESANVTKNTNGWRQLRKFILQASQSCNEMMLECRFGSIMRNCSSLFEPILTDEGLCCTFNHLHPDFIFTKDSRDGILFGNNPEAAHPVKWTPEDGYQETLPNEYYPRRAVGTGINMGLSVIMNVSRSEYFCSSMRGAGFKMLLHSPAEMPKITNYGYLLSAGFETQVVIEPLLDNAALSARRIKSKNRHCLFNDEAHLRFYQIYTKDNCELECESKRLAQECGCVTYNLPRISRETAVCGVQDFPCIRRVRFESESLITENTTCARCVPACVSLQYFPVLSTTILSAKGFALPMNYSLDELNVSDLSVVHFFYEGNSFRARIKEEFLGFPSFLASSGGILGLFLGFSMISLVELIYFIFLVPYSIATNYGIKIRKTFSQKVEIDREIKIFLRGQITSPAPSHHSQRFFGENCRTSYGFFDIPPASSLEQLPYYD